jgi:hypothetical protein
MYTDGAAAADVSRTEPEAQSQMGAKAIKKARQKEKKSVPKTFNLSYWPESDNVAEVAVASVGSAAAPASASQQQPQQQELMKPQQQQKQQQQQQQQQQRSPRVIGGSGALAIAQKPPAVGSASEGWPALGGRT